MSANYGPRSEHSSRGDEINHRDTGCDLHAACLTCPFVQCRYDEPIVTQQRSSRNVEILRLFGEGMRTSAIAERFGISRRTVLTARTQASRSE